MGEAKLGPLGQEELPGSAAEAVGPALAPAVSDAACSRRHSGAQCITCSYKASSGLLYPLERGFIYVHKPPVHIRFDEISFVNFARGTTTTRSFDFEIETKQGTQYTFSSIERWAWGPALPGGSPMAARP